MQAGPARKVVPRACDACCRRKIKCNGHQPCSGCMSTNLTCAYVSPRRQGGNRGARATNNTALSPASATSESNNSPLTTHLDTKFIFVEVCIDAYMNHIRLVVPILTRHALETELRLSKTSLASRQFISAFCAYVANFGNALEHAQTNHRVYSGGDVGRQTHNGLGDYQQGWFYLREATTLFSLSKVDAVDWYDQSAQTCMFWILLISESPKLSSAQAPGLQHLASVFEALDEILFAVWNGSSKQCSKEWLIQLERDVRTALPPVLEVSNEEMVNLRVSQFWLRIKLWELFPRFSFLSTESVYECLTFRYPIAVVIDLTDLAMKLLIASLQVHGVGMTEKVFDIACAVADVLPLPGGTCKFVPLLLVKVNELRPELVTTLCAATQMPLAVFNDPMSPDTRFMYEEEVGRGLYADLRRAR
ncbi:hypothetical protein EJ07DRAFT_161586 [Lizonia empirigonia]|nr:hypothetical protein EJ07DRAFT_161586 [Lizonia empirigonia]